MPEQKTHDHNLQLNSEFIFWLKSMTSVVWDEELLIVMVTHFEASTNLKNKSKLFWMPAWFSHLLLLKPIFKLAVHITSFYFLSITQCSLFDMYCSFKYWHEAGEYKLMLKCNLTEGSKDPRACTDGQMNTPYIIRWLNVPRVMEGAGPQDETRTEPWCTFMHLVFEKYWQ